MAWFMRPTWNDAEAGCEVIDGFVNHRYAARDLLAFAREQCQPALLCRFNFDHHAHDWSVWLLWREPPRAGALEVVHSYLASEEFLRAALPATSSAVEDKLQVDQITEELRTADRALDAEREARLRAEQRMSTLLQTKTFRYSAPLRGAYARLKWSHSAFEGEPTTTELVRQSSRETVTERLTPDMFGSASAGHEARYCLAAGFLRPGDVVIDAACGIAFGATLLCKHGDVTYYGVDKDLSHSIVSSDGKVHLIEADLVTWTPSFEFDVLVGFETVEHLSDYSVYFQWARNARRFVVFSVPIIPTVGTNPFHLHDFQQGDLIELFVDDNWRLFQFFEQPAEVAGVYIFARNEISPMDG